MTIKNKIAPASAGGAEWRKIHARLTGSKLTLDIDDIRHEYADEARNEREVYESVTEGE